MKRAGRIVLLAALVFPWGCSSAVKEATVLEATGALAKEDAFKADMLLGILDVVIQKNPGWSYPKELKAEALKSLARSQQVAQQIVAVIQSAPSLSDEQKADLMAVWDVALELYKSRGQ